MDGLLKTPLQWMRHRIVGRFELTPAGSPDETFRQIVQKIKGDSGVIVNRASSSWPRQVVGNGH
jgi:hypothetical protein